MAVNRALGQMLEYNIRAAKNIWSIYPGIY